jgi:pyruvate/2-oxoglutarate dehydrogenase complex dihydrolipoamide dehydrogenase (E3) component
MSFLKASESFDLVVIGGGPAGLAAALAAGIFGKRVALIERAHDLGGALVNTGTIPSKTLRETALALSGFRSRELYAIDLSLRRTANVSDFLRHERAVKRVAHGNIAGRLERRAVTRVQGSARFMGPHVVEVTAAGKRDGSHGASRGASCAAASSSSRPAAARRARPNSRSATRECGMRARSSSSSGCRGG